KIALDDRDPLRGRQSLDRLVDQRLDLLPRALATIRDLAPPLLRSFARALRTQHADRKVRRHAMEPSSERHLSRRRRARELEEALLRDIIRRFDSSQDAPRRREDEARVALEELAKGVGIARLHPTLEKVGVCFEHVA